MDLGLNQSPARSMMSDGNKKWDWKVFESLYYRVLKHYERVLKSESERNIIAEIKHQSQNPYDNHNFLVHTIFFLNLITKLFAIGAVYLHCLRLNLLYQIFNYGHQQKCSYLFSCFNKLSIADTIRKT